MRIRSSAPRSKGRRRRGVDGVGREHRFDVRAEDILGWVPGYWEHYVEQARSDRPVLDPAVRLVLTPGVAVDPTSSQNGIDPRTVIGRPAVDRGRGHAVVHEMHDAHH